MRHAPASRERFARVALAPPIRMPIIDALERGTTSWFPMTARGSRFAFTLPAARSRTPR